MMDKNLSKIMDGHFKQVSPLRQITREIFERLEKLNEGDRERLLCSLLTLENQKLYRHANRRRIPLPFKKFQDKAELWNKTFPFCFDHTKYFTIEEIEHFGKDAKHFKSKMILTEPYQLYTKDLEECIEWAKKNNMEIYIGHNYPSLHYPNNTIPICFISNEKKIIPKSEVKA